MLHSATSIPEKILKPHFLHSTKFPGLDSIGESLGMKLIFDINKIYEDLVFEFHASTSNNQRRKSIKQEPHK